MQGQFVKWCFWVNYNIISFLEPEEISNIWHVEHQHRICSLMENSSKSKKISLYIWKPPIHVNRTIDISIWLLTNFLPHLYLLFCYHNRGYHNRAKYALPSTPRVAVHVSLPNLLAIETLYVPTSDLNTPLIMRRITPFLSASMMTRALGLSWLPSLNLEIKIAQLMCCF